MTYNNGIYKVMGIECEDYEEVYAILAGHIEDAIIQKKTFDEIVEMFEDSDIEFMREYYLYSDVNFTNESVDLKEDCVYAFMRLMAVKDIIDNACNWALDILKCFNETM